MDLSDDVSTSSNLVPEEDELLGKKRKHMSSYPDTSLFKAYNSTSSNGKFSLVILKQPEKQHRARYHTEGSRGAVKDRGQTGFPTVQLRGYHSKKPAMLQVFVGSDTGTPIPHLYYQACKVSGKNSTPCREVKKENTDVILIELEPDKDRIVVCDCVGILKERHSDIEGKVPPNKRVNWKKKTTKCRMVFRTEVEIEETGQTEILQVVTETISCTQLPGTPEILKMSMATCSIEGGEELWLIGKNFLKDTEVIFKEESSNSRTLWYEKVKPIKEFFSNNHLIVVVPPYKDPNSTESVVINISVKCGSKASEPKPLTLKAAQTVVKLNGLLQPTNNGSLAVVNLANGGHNLMMTMQPCKEEPLSNLNTTSRPTILEQIEEHTPQIKNVGPHVSRVCKKRRERKTPFSRTREQPEIDADEAMFDTVDTSSTSLDRGIVTLSALLQRHTQRQASADRIPTESSSKTVVQNSNAYRQQILIPDDNTTAINAEVTNFMEESSNTNTTIRDQNTVTSPTAHFENLSFQTVQPLSFAGITKSEFKFDKASQPQQQSQVSQPTQQQTTDQTQLYTAQPQTQQFKPVEVVQQPTQPSAQPVLRGATLEQPASNPEEYYQSDQQKTQQQQTSSNNETKESGCSLGIDNSGSESATISIKLPPSVLQDQKQLSTIVNTISKALQPQQNNATDEENSPAQQTFSPETLAAESVSPPTYHNPTSNQNSWTQSPPDSSGIIQEPWEDPNGFEKKRKRVLESEFVGVTTDSPESAWTNNQAANTGSEWDNQAQTSWATTQQTWDTNDPIQSSVAKKEPPTPVVSTSAWTETPVVSTSAWTETPAVSTSAWAGTPFANVVTTTENSSDSGSCTKWENINAKPLGQWPSEATSTSTQLNNFLDSHQTWTNTTENASWTESKPAWPSSDLNSQNSVVSAEMIPVNPKEVSPMDVDDMFKCPTTSASISQFRNSVHQTSVVSKLTVVSTAANPSASVSTNTNNIINSFT